MIYPFEPISDNEFLLNRLKMLSSLSVTLLAETLQVPAAKILEHPLFEEEANKMIDKITFRLCQKQDQ